METNIDKTIERSGSYIGAISVIKSHTDTKTLHIQGSKHSVYYWGEDKIKIGCMQLSISEWEWESKYTTIGIQHGYTRKQIKEYENYVKLIKSFHKQNTKGNENKDS